MKKQSLPSDVTRLAQRVFEGLGTPVALSAHIKMREGDWEGLAALSVKPSSYADAASYFKDACAVAFLKKLEQLPGDSALRRARTIEKWWEAEHACYHTNQRLSAYLPENRVFEQGQVAGIYAVIALIRKIIFGWLGSSPPSLVDGRFGPGATFSDRGVFTTIPDKMSSNPSLTRDAVWFLPQWFGTQWGASLAQRHGELSFVEGNRFATVPKTALIDRSIASEPSINGFYQLALGRELRKRLRRAGWDLDRAQDIHRRVAEVSSVSREFATLDLSNASDTVSKECVKLLLPHAWYDQLADLRSKRTWIDGKWVVLEKFSSMGNGYTFELETIIFAAITCAITQLCGGLGQLGKDVFVFGDDIICKDGVVSEVTAALKFFGFSLNLEKSFHGNSPFRESCGADFYEGKSVRPFYMKGLPEGPEGWIVVANGLRRVNQRLKELDAPALTHAWFHALDQMPTAVRQCRGPEGLGDIVIHDDEAYWTTRTRHSIRYIRSFRPWRTRLVHYDYFDASVVLACATYGTGGTENPEGVLRAGQRYGVTPRDGILAYKVGWVPHS